MMLRRRMRWSVVVFALALGALFGGPIAHADDDRDEKKPAAAETARQRAESSRQRTESTRERDESARERAAAATRERAEAARERADSERQRLTAAARERAEAIRERAEFARERPGANRERTEAARERAEAARDRAHADGERAKADRERSAAERERSEAARERARANRQRSELDRHGVIAEAHPLTEPERQAALPAVAPVAPARPLAPPPAVRQVTPPLAPTLVDPDTEFEPPRETEIVETPNLTSQRQTPPASAPLRPADGVDRTERPMALAAAPIDPVHTVLTKSVEPMLDGARFGLIGTGLTGLLVAAVHFARRRLS
jgi:hypothetical protein